MKGSENVASRPVAHEALKIKSISESQLADKDRKN
jgi:hypothetical protein